MLPIDGFEMSDLEFLSVVPNKVGSRKAVTEVVNYFKPICASHPSIDLLICRLLAVQYLNAKDDTPPCVNFRKVSNYKDWVTR
jgi:hypothetical protein